MNKATWTDKGLLSSQKKGLKVLRCPFQGYSTTNSEIKFEKKKQKTAVLHFVTESHLAKDDFRGLLIKMFYLRQLSG